MLSGELTGNIQVTKDFRTCGGGPTVVGESPHSGWNLHNENSHCESGPQYIIASFLILRHSPSGSYPTTRQQLLLLTRTMLGDILRTHPSFLTNSIQCVHYQLLGHTSCSSSGRASVCITALAKTSMYEV